MRYKCYYVSGDSREHDAGVWEKKETDKTLTFTLVEEPFFSPNYKLIRINKFYSQKHPRNDGNYSAWRDFGDYIGWVNNGHVLRDWKNGTYTAYPNQCGTPYVFTPIN
jgi:hypothetical protein